MVRYRAADEIMKCIGDISRSRLFGNQVLLAPFVQSGLLWNPKMGFPLEEVLSLEKLYELYEGASGLVSRQHSLESIWQGKLSLVLKLGDEADKYGLKPLDWVWTLSENTRMVSISPPGAQKSRVLQFLGVDYTGYPCKIAYETDLYGQEPDPFRIV